MLAAAAVLGMMTLNAITTPWSLLVLSFILGLGTTLNGPAWQAIFPEPVSGRDLAPAIALNGVQFNLACAAGPALGGLIVGVLGAGFAFILNALSFLGVILVLYRWRRPPAVLVLPAERIIEAIRTGLRY